MMRESHTPQHHPRRHRHHDDPAAQSEPYGDAIPNDRRPGRGRGRGHRRGGGPGFGGPGFGGPGFGPGPGGGKAVVLADGRFVTMGAAPKLDLAETTVELWFRPDFKAGVKYNPCVIAKRKRAGRSAGGNGTIWPSRVRPTR